MGGRSTRTEGRRALSQREEWAAQQRPPYRQFFHCARPLFRQHFRMIFGAHCSTAGGVRMALSRAERIAAECVQIFVKNNMQWLGKPPGPEEAAGFAADRARAGFKAVFGHAGYLINLGGPPSPNRAKSLQSLIQEISFAGALGLPFLVLHPGAHLGAGEERGLELIVAGLDEALAKTKKLGRAPCAGKHGGAGNLPRPQNRASGGDFRCGPAAGEARALPGHRPLFCGGI